MNPFILILAGFGVLVLYIVFKRRETEVKTSSTISGNNRALIESAKRDLFDALVKIEKALLAEAEIVNNAPAPYQETEAYEDNKFNVQFLEDYRSTLDDLIQELDIFE